MKKLFTVVSVLVVSEHAPLRLRAGCPGAGAPAGRKTGCCRSNEGARSDQSA